MFCNKCGKPLEDNSKFCSYCGTKLELIVDNPTPCENFTMPIKDVFSITGRGTVITGVVEKGTISVGDEITIPGYVTGRFPVDGISISKNLVQSASKGDDVGLLISRLARDLDLVGKMATAAINESAHDDVSRPKDPAKGKIGGFDMDFISSSYNSRRINNVINHEGEDVIIPQVKDITPTTDNQSVTNLNDQNNTTQPGTGYNANSFNNSGVLMECEASMYDHDISGKAGIAKAEGTLKLYADHFEYKVRVGNALGGMFGVVGLLATRKKAKENYAVAIPYSEIRECKLSKYLLGQPAIVLTLSSGVTVSYVNGYWQNGKCQTLYQIILEQMEKSKNI